MVLGRRLLALLILAAGVGIPLALWLQEGPARAAALLPVYQEPPPLPVAVAPLAPLPEPEVPAQALRPARLEIHHQPAELPSLRGPGLLLLAAGTEGRPHQAALGHSPLLLEGLAPGRWRLQVAPGPAGALGKPLWDKEIELVPGEEAKLQLVLPLASLAGTVEPGGTTRGPGFPFQVRLFTSAGWQETLTDQEGQFAFTGLVPGPALLLVEAGPSSGLSGACRTLTLEPAAQTRTTIKLQAPAEAPAGSREQG